jgi:hypothetical protein
MSTALYLSGTALGQLDAAQQALDAHPTCKTVAARTSAQRTKRDAPCSRGTAGCPAVSDRGKLASYGL